VTPCLDQILHHPPTSAGPRGQASRTSLPASLLAPLYHLLLSPQREKRQVTGDVQRGRGGREGEATERGRAGARGGGARQKAFVLGPLDWASGLGLPDPLRSHTTPVLGKE